MLGNYNVCSCLTEILLNSFDFWLNLNNKFSLNDINLDNLNSIEIPILILCPMKDRIVNKSNSVNIFDNVKSNDKIL